MINNTEFRAMTYRIEHPRLGFIEAEKREWRVKQELSFACIRQSTSRVSIIVPEAGDEPSIDQLQTVVDLMDASSSLRGEIEEAIFKEFPLRIRPYYVPEDMLEMLPAQREPADVWKLITKLYSVWVDKHCVASLAFSVIFDEEHELKVHIEDGKVDFVSMG